MMKHRASSFVLYEKNVTYITGEIRYGNFINFTCTITIYDKIGYDNR